MPLLILPFGLTLIFLIIFAKKKSLILLVPTIFISFFGNGIISEMLWRYIESPWERLSVKEMPKADAIVVLSQKRHLPPGKSKIIEWWHDPDRFMSGLMLLKAKKAEKIIFTGGSSPYLPELPPEGNIYKQEAIAFGIEPNKILTTRPVSNTIEESKAVKSILSNKKATILLVTSAFHMKRAKKLFEKESIIVIPYPVDFKSSKYFGKKKLLNPYNFFPNASSLHSSSKAIREIMGRLKYNTF
ncbi:hypothetical protein CU303_00870 [Prochlorococcus marinus str. MU1417]|nr:YdcF family protein [Prochlorococcus marinus CUG1417]MBW3074229.1 hypothetical protein [Prochlorococcus marinus str. MU1417]